MHESVNPGEDESRTDHRRLTRFNRRQSKSLRRLSHSHVPWTVPVKFGRTHHLLKSTRNPTPVNMIDLWKCSRDSKGPYRTWVTDRHVVEDLPRATDIFFPHIGSFRRMVGTKCSLASYPKPAFSSRYSFPPSLLAFAFPHKPRSRLFNQSTAKVQIGIWMKV